MAILSKINNYCHNKYASIRDFRIDRKIVVFESDDWGSIRMPKREGWERLLSLGFAVDKRPYERFDTLESPGDVEALFSVLRKFEDKNGNHPIITANMLVANPNFEQIEKSGFREYFYEGVATTYQRYFGDTRVLDIMRQGIEDKVFVPQFHGREHFNVSSWIKELKSNNADVLTAFQYRICGIAPRVNPSVGNHLMNALLASDDLEQRLIDQSLVEGLQMFESLWGFRSRTFVAPCYLWPPQSEKVLAENGVELIQTARSSKPVHKLPKRYFYSGQKNQFGQIYSTRNCKFEPSTREGGLTAVDLLNQVENRFRENKIAIISSHRINYVSGIDKENSIKTLNILEHFLTLLLKKYPDVEFLSTIDLLDIYTR